MHHREPPHGPPRAPAGRRPRAWAALAGALLLGACQAGGPPGRAAAPDGPAAEAALLARIRAEIGGAPCDADSQCRTLAIGAKACGGPQGWLAWSVRQGHPAQLQAWADELARLQRERQAREGLASDCRYLPDPGAACRAGRCVSLDGGAGPSRPGGAAAR